MVLSRFERWAVIVYAVKKAQSRGIRVGHTLLQKLIYLLQEGFKVPLEYEYKLHHFGPYSEFLWGEITTLRDYGFINIKTDPEGYGYDISIGKESEWIKSKEKYIPKEKIDSLLDVIGDKFTKDLELLATTHYIYKENEKEGSVNEKEIISQVCNIKPHFSKYQVKTAIKYLKENGLL